MVARGADWSSISPQLLSTIFEMQRNALDNCAAACTCVQWRQAVSESQIAHLHLHADSPSYNSNWRSFFQSRRSIASLKLTSDIRQRRNTWAPLLAKSVEQGCCLKQIPPGCSALSASHDFLGVPGCISHLVGLQHVKFPYNPPCQYGKKAPLPDLSFLDHLRKLELNLEHNPHFDKDDELSSFSMPSRILPVEHLVLNGAPCHLHVLENIVTALATLELIHCRLLKADLFKIGSLRSLNLEASWVEYDGECIPDWTQLTFLRLTYSYWLSGGNAAPALKAFYGWPCLRVLQCNGCNLFDDCTDLQLEPAMQLQLALDSVTPGTDCAELSLVNMENEAVPDDISACIESVLHASCLVRLQLYFEYDNYASLTSNMFSWLEACPCLQVLSLSAPDHLWSSYPVPAVLAPNSTQVACLREVQLHHLPFGVVDLQKASCLSVLKLKVNRCVELCRLSVPTGLLHSEFGGSFLFAGHGRSALCGCSMMTKLALIPFGLAQIGGIDFGMPILPSSLAHLIFD